MSNRAQNIIQLFEVFFTGGRSHPFKLTQSDENMELYQSKFTADGVGIEIYLVVDLKNGAIVPNWTAGTPGDMDTYSTSRKADRISQRAVIQVFGTLAKMIDVTMKKHGDTIKKMAFSGDQHDPGKNRLYRLFARKIAQKYGGRSEHGTYMNRINFE